jgi:hypothetical protein
MHGTIAALSVLVAVLAMWTSGFSHGGELFQGSHPWLGSTLLGLLLGALGMQSGYLK